MNNYTELAFGPITPVPTPRPFAGGAGGAGVDPWGNGLRNVSSRNMASTAAPGAMGKPGGMFGNFFGENGMANMELLLQGVGTIGSLWNAFEAQKMAKKQFAFQKDFAEKNLANSVQSYNTSLSDRAKARAVYNGDGVEVAQKYIEDNRLNT